jgi:HK97 family phage portal protein
MNGLTTEIIAGVHLIGAAQYRSLENPNLPLNDPAIWEEVFGDTMRAHTGESISHDRAMTYAPVWQAVSLISGDVAKLPLVLYKQGAGGVREPIEDSPLVDLVQLKPNEEEHAFKFWRRVMVHALLWGNGYVFIVRDDMGEPVELLHLLPDRTNMERHGGELWCITEADGRLEAIRAEDVIHLEGLSVECLEGRDMLDAARNSWALGLAQEKFSSLFFKHGGRVGGILEVPPMTKAGSDRIEEGFRKSYEGADNPFRTVILRDNAKFHQAQTSPRDSQLVEGSEAQVRQTARWFNLSPSKLGLSDSVSYNSKTEDNQDYLDATLSHWLKPLAMECTIKLLTAKQRRKLWFEHDTAELLRMNPSERADFYQKMIASLVLNPNEARRMENLPPYEGGNEYVNPSTTPGELPENGEKPAKNEEKPAPKREIDHNLARVVFKAGDHARYKANKPTAFIEWVDGGLTTHKEEARKLLGAETTVIDAMLLDLKRLAATKDAAALPLAVDELMQTYERSVFDGTT